MHIDNFYLNYTKSYVIMENGFLHTMLGYCYLTRG